MNTFVPSLVPGASPRVISAVACAMFVVIAGGCAVRESSPRTRVGALPFPGPYTLYTTADPAHLGVHQYGRLPRFFQPDEKERGIVYTARAGFLDMAHMRESIDWTRYDTKALHAAVLAGETQLTLAPKDRSRLHVALHYPDDWNTLPEAERVALAKEIARIGGQRLTLLRMTWHETVTWFGYRRVPMIDESRSAFSYDDTMSHVIGTRVAVRAMRETGLDADAETWDRAATAALAAELAELGAVGPRETTDAAKAVEGQWWADGTPIRRHMDEGEWNPDKPAIHPWLVPEAVVASAEDSARAASALPQSPEAFELPTFRDVRGRDLSGFMSVEIEPSFAGVDDILRRLPGSPKRVSAATELPVLLAVVRAEMREQFGPHAVDPPWALKSATSVVASDQMPARVDGLGEHAVAPPTTPAAGAH